MHAVNPGDLALLTDDELLIWAAQGSSEGVRAWIHGDAVVVAVDDVARRSRLAVTGPIDQVEMVVRQVLDEPGGARYRPIGDEGLIAALCERVPMLTPTPGFGWMHTTRAPATDSRVRPALDNELAAVRRLLQVAFPDSLATPGQRGVHCWWIIPDGEEVMACAADAWSAPGAGLLAGVASAPSARGQGLGRAVAATVLRHLVAEYGSACLMVESDNHAARGIYSSLGMSYRPLLAATRG